MKTIKELCDIERENAFAIHLYHGHGHLEKVYENALANRLRKAGIDVKQQHPLSVYDEDGALIGEYFCRPVRRWPFDRRTEGLPVSGG
jgi:GxxExxY protein